MVRAALREPTRLGAMVFEQPCGTKRAEEGERRGSNLTTYKKKVEDMTSYPILARVLPGRSFTRQKSI